ncbi:hypothetical protein [Streptomyces laurentii]|uniref:hypothetical protein n=1 Tax=Streptomyces laurentii TaxID=39478 RepID=UPI0036CAD312
MTALRKVLTGRVFWRMMPVAVLVLCLEAVLVMVLVVLCREAPEPSGQPDAETGGGGFGLFIAAFLLGIVLPTLAAPAVVLAAALVVPAVLLGDWLADRVGGPAVGWQLLCTAAGAALVSGAFGVWPLSDVTGWLAMWAGLAVAALVTRRTRPGGRYPVLVLLWGLAVIVVVLAGGLIGG